MSTPSSIWALALPIILSNITVPLIGAVDAAVMGHMDSAAYLGGAAIGALIFDYIYWGFGFLRLSTTGLSAQALGANQGDEARSIFARATLIALIASLGLWVLQTPIFHIAASLLEASNEVESLAGDYYAIRIWSAPAVLTNYVIIGWLLACKNTKAVLFQQVLTNLINAVLDILFVYQLGMGIEGVALATVISQYSGLGFGLFLMKRQLGQIDGKWHLADMLVRDKIKRLMGMNSDLFIRTVCLLSAFAWFSAQGAKMGDHILAANAILIQFLMFASYGLDGFAHAVEILSAHSVGKKDREDFFKNFRLATTMSFVGALLFSLIYILLGDYLIALFTDLPILLETAHAHAIWMMILPVVAIWCFQLDGVYLGLTQTKMLRNMMVLSLALFIPLSLWMIDLWGNHGLWAAFTIFMGLRAITLGIAFPGVTKKVFP